MTPFKRFIYQEDYESAMRYLARTETRHAPKLDMDQLPVELQEVMRVAYMPRGEERSRWLNDFAKRTWEVPDGEAEVLLAKEHLNAIRYLNRYLREANKKLKQDGYLLVACDTSAKRRVQFYSKYPRFLAGIFYFFDFLWHRVCPKLGLTRRFYYLCTRKVRKVFPRPEVLGRLYYCGFDVVSEQYIHDRYCVIAQKRRQPDTDHPDYGLVVKLNRIGKNAERIQLYKFRTMYAYSEYLQTYVYENNNLQPGGKFKDDYRITTWGRWLRKYWFDEWPMLINVFKGQMKLVGVRPLSQQYFNLYKPEIQELRIKSKPGMLPPYYADMPETLDEIQESERRYCEEYEKHPFRTDWKYFWKIQKNILFGRKRSK